MKKRRPDNVDKDQARPDRPSRNRHLKHRAHRGRALVRRGTKRSEVVRADSIASAAKGAIQVEGSADTPSEPINEGIAQRIFKNGVAVVLVKNMAASVEADGDDRGSARGDFRRQVGVKAKQPAAWWNRCGRVERDKLASRMNARVGATNPTKVAHMGIHRADRTEQLASNSAGVGLNGVAVKVGAVVSDSKKNGVGSGIQDGRRVEQRVGKIKGRRASPKNEPRRTPSSPF